MQTGIHIEGGKVTKQAVAAVAEGITQIFEAAAETRMEQETVRAALGLLRDVGAVSHTRIEGCHLESHTAADESN